MKGLKLKKKLASALKETGFTKRGPSGSGESWMAKAKAGGGQRSQLTNMVDSDHDKKVKSSDSLKGSGGKGKSLKKESQSGKGSSPDNNQKTSMTEAKKGKGSSHNSDTGRMSSGGY